MKKRIAVKLASLIIIQIILFFLYVYLKKTLLNDTFSLIWIGIFILLELILSILIAIVIVKELRFQKWKYLLIIPCCLIFSFLLLASLTSIYRSNKPYRQEYKSSFIPIFIENETANLYNYGNQQMKLGNYEKAIKIYDKVLSIEPFHSSTLLNQSVCYGYIGLFEKEIEICKIGIKNNPNFAQFYSNIGMAYLRTKNFKEVIPNLLKAIELDKKNQIIYTLNIAQAYYEMGEYESTCYVLDTIQPININKKAVLQELKRMKSLYCNK